MPYAHRAMHDADAHVMETPDWLEPFTDPGIREKLPPVYVSTVKPGEDRLIDRFRAMRPRRGWGWPVWTSIMTATWTCS